MSVKKSLVVDDSKSARAVLKRMLNKLGLEVDTVESATDAIVYLEENCPDVIFMDHMMPEIDGFEAVKRIKNNPATAVIPILMYTSKGGDVYLSKARDLGAIGIISKTISPVGLNESLFELGLVDDRQIETTLEIDTPLESDITTQDITPVVSTDNSARDVYLKDMQRLMDEQTIELHKSMWLGIESVSNEIFNRLKREREEQVENSKSTVTDKKEIPLLVYFVAFLFALSIIFNISLLTENNQLENELATASKIQAQYVVAATIEANARRTMRIATDKFQDRLDFIAWANNLVFEYPFNELALSGQRLSRIEKIVNKALEVNYKGSIIIQTHVGRFCFSRDFLGELALADDNLPVKQCDYIGNDVQPNDLPSAHQSLAFANYLSEMKKLSEQGIEIEVENISRVYALADYPEYELQAIAADWNVAAKINNQVTIILEPIFEVP